MAKTGLQDTSAKEATRLKDPPQDPAGRIAGSDYAMILLENTPLAMAMFDEDLRYLIANQKWVEEFSLESISFKGRGHFEIFPELEDGWHKTYEHCLQGDVEHFEEDVLERPDGSTDWVRWELRPWHRSDLSVGGLIASCEIITPLKQAEQILKDDRDLVSALLSGSSPVVVLDATGHIIRHSQGALPLADTSASPEGEIIGLSFTEAFPMDGVSASSKNSLLSALESKIGDGDTAGTVITRGQTSNPEGIATCEIFWTLSPGVDEHGVLTQLVLTGVPKKPEDQNQQEIFSPVLPKHSSQHPSSLSSQSSSESASKRIAAPATQTSGSSPFSSTLRQETESALARLQAATNQTPGKKSISPGEPGLRAAENAPLGLILLDPDAAILYANKHVSQLLGSDLHAGDDIEDWLRHGCPDEAYAKAIRAEWRNQIWEKRLPRILTLAKTDGLLREIEFRPSLLSDDFLLLTIADVTGTQRGEEALRASENRLRKFFESTPVAIALTDPSGHIFDANPALESLLGCSRLNLRKTPLNDFINSDDHSKIQQHLESSHQLSKQVGTVAVEALRAGGELIPVRLHIALITDENGKPAFTSYLILPREEEPPDTTELIKSQMQNQALFSASKEAVLLVDRHTKTVLDIHVPKDFPSSFDEESFQSKCLTELLQSTEGDNLCPLTPHLVELKGKAEILHLECRLATIDERLSFLFATPHTASGLHASSSKGLGDVLAGSQRKAQTEP